ncbi:hypothetical protein [Rugosibacter aromaticivorans]|uniref:hypothetical protein n=1 Tax=Rugosibacter aromaticivorans TaxID=1565605 RepID=UPI0012289AB7|nr:hypothetical protein [Rugosibacter aromaticivorans]TBR15876.1 MAG: hypothetical protein EPO43_02300 [Rugosibacter sp.]
MNRALLAVSADDRSSVKEGIQRRSKSRVENYPAEKLIEAFWYAWKQAQFRCLRKVGAGETAENVVRLLLFWFSPIGQNRTVWVVIPSDWWHDANSIHCIR